MERDYPALSRALVRLLRGRRSRAALSRRLGYTSNAVFTWEQGTAYPTAARFFELAQCTGIDLQQVLLRFFRALPPRLRSNSLLTAEGVQLFMQELMGRTAILAVAQPSGLSRFSISRWLSGKSQPKLPEFLCFVEHASLRLLDLLDTLVNVEQLPALAEEWRMLQAARDIGYAMPFSHAVLRALETQTYAASDGSSLALAKLLGIEPRVVDQCLERLKQAGQARCEQTHWIAVQSNFVDFRRDLEAAQRVKAFWAALAAERVVTRRPGLFAYNVFAVSREDLARLEALQREYLSQMHAIIDQSNPTDVVALANFQLFAFDA